MAADFSDFLVKGLFLSASDVQFLQKRTTSPHKEVYFITTQRNNSDGNTTIWELNLSPLDISSASTAAFKALNTRSLSAKK